MQLEDIIKITSYVMAFFVGLLMSRIISALREEDDDTIEYYDLTDVHEMEYKEQYDTNKQTN